MSIPALRRGDRGVEVEELHGWKAAVVRIGDVIYVLDEYGRTAGTRHALHKALQRASELLTDGREWPEPILIRGVYELEDTVKPPSYVELRIEGLIRAPAGFNKPFFDVSGLKEVLFRGSGVLDGNRAGQTEDMDAIYAGEAVEGLRVEGLRFRRFTRSAVRVTAGGWSKRVCVEGCRFEDTPDPVRVNLTEWFRIDGNLFLQNLESGVTAWADMCRRGSISRNLVYGGGINLRVSSVEEVVIAGNVVRAELGTPSGGGGITVTGTSRYVDVVGNVVSGKDMEGIEFAGGVEHCQAVGNVLVRCGCGGFKCWQFKHCRIAENIVIDCGSDECPEPSQDYPISAAIILNTNETEHETMHNVVEDNVIIFTGAVRPADYAIAEARYLDRGVIDHNVIRRNRIYGSPSVAPVHILGPNTIVEDVTGYKTENSGTASFSGDGSTTQFAIPHGLAGAPSRAVVTPLSADAAGDHYVTWDDVNIYVNYLTAPPAGTDNVKLAWMAEV